MTSGMGAHIREYHPNADLARPESLVEMRVIDHRPKNMERGICEAILIEEMERDDKCITTNRKAEWGRAPIRTLTVRGNLD